LPALPSSAGAEVAVRGTIAAAEAPADLPRRTAAALDGEKGCASQQASPLELLTRRKRGGPLPLQLPQVAGPMPRATRCSQTTAMRMQSGKAGGPGGHHAVQNKGEGQGPTNFREYLLALGHFHGGGELNSVQCQPVCRASGKWAGIHPRVGYRSACLPAYKLATMAVLQTVEETSCFSAAGGTASSISLDPAKLICVRQPRVNEGQEMGWGAGEARYRRARPDLGAGACV
jgi:hypothetical protein